MEITVYSTTTCPYCKMLKKYLEEKGISFKEKIIDQDDAAREEMMKMSGGFLGVPFTVVQKEDRRDTVVGFNKVELNRVLGIKT